jgi:sugar phosphate isomerase/epimerase
VYIACSTLCFGRVSLDQAFATIHEMRYSKVDLAIHESGPHLRPSEVLADVNRHALMLRAAGMSFAAFHLEIQANDPDHYKEQLRGLCRFARLMTVPVICISAARAGSDFEDEVRRLTGLCKLAVSEGVILTVETHRETMTADPLGAAELCHRVPGLGLTLDPSHYTVGPHPLPDYDEIYPHVCHVRLRDTASEKMQVRVGQGQIEYGKIVSLLEREDYDRALTVDIRDLPPQDYPTDPEVRKLKYLLESMV